MALQRENDFGCIGSNVSHGQAMTLLADVNRPGSQEDVVSNWEPAHSLVEDASPWGRDCSTPLLCGSGCHTPACLPLGSCGGGACTSSVGWEWGRLADGQKASRLIFCCLLASLLFKFIQKGQILYYAYLVILP